MLKFLPILILLCMFSSAKGQEKFELRPPDYEPYILELTPLSVDHTLHTNYLDFIQEYQSGNASYVIAEINKLILSLDTAQIDSRNNTNGKPFKSTVDTNEVRNSLSATREFLFNIKEQLKHDTLILGEKDRLHKLVFYYYLSTYDREHWFTFPSIKYGPDFSLALYNGCLNVYKILFLSQPETLYGSKDLPFYSEYNQIGFFTLRFLMKQWSACPDVLANKDVAAFKGLLEDVSARKVGFMYRILE